MAKSYPLKIENVGEDTYTLMSRGWHDPDDFLRACAKAHPNWSMGFPSITHWKAIPDRRPGYACRYVEVDGDVRGAFEVTVAVEAYGEDAKDWQKAKAEKERHD